jgi:hypothetical protein
VRNALDRYFPDAVPLTASEEDEVGNRCHSGKAIGVKGLIRELAGMRREIVALQQLMMNLTVTPSIQDFVVPAEFGNRLANR